MSLPWLVIGPLLAALTLWAARAWRERETSAVAAAAVVVAEAALLGVTLFTVPGALATALGTEPLRDGTGLLDRTVLTAVFVPAVLMALHFRRLGNGADSLLWTWVDSGRGSQGTLTARFWAFNATLIVLVLAAPYLLRALWVFRLLEYSETLAAGGRANALIGASLALGAPLLVLLGATRAGSPTAGDALRATGRLAGIVVCASLVAMLIADALPERNDIRSLRILSWDLGVLVALGAFVTIGWRQQTHWVEAETRLLASTRDAAIAARQVADAERLALDAKTQAYLAQVDLDAVIESVRRADELLASEPDNAAAVLSGEIFRLKTKVAPATG